MGRLAGKTALITGAGSGLGEAMARAFAREGARVAIADINAENGAKVAASIEGAIFIPLDVRDEAAWQEGMGAAEKAFGKLSIVVNNAGVSVPSPIDQASLAHWRQTMAVNLDGVFLGCKYGVEALRRAGGGTIINIASTLGKRAGAIFPAYCASKGGVLMLTKAVALRCAEAGWAIRVNAILPGAILTPIMDPYFAAGPSKDAVVAGFAAVHPMKRVGEAHEIADAAVFLASEEASFITGAELPVDGGYLA
jgi:3(or 17)beta-hydroxysteroid dehydrogenase